MENELMTGLTLDQVESLVSTILRRNGVPLRAPHSSGDTHPDVPRPEDVDTGDRKRIFKGIKQVTLDAYEEMSEEERKQYIFFVREESGATFGFVGIGNLKYTMVPEDIRGLDCGFFDCPPITSATYSYLTFTNVGNEPVTVGLTIQSPDQAEFHPVIYYTEDEGETWIDWWELTRPDFSQSTEAYYQNITINPGNNVKMYGENPDGFSFGPQNQQGETPIIHLAFFTTTGPVSVTGDLTTLITREGTLDIPSNWCFRNIFANTSILTAPDMPATGLTWGCYHGAYTNCQNLTIAPELPATEITCYCYAEMFSYCTALTVAQQTLPGTTLRSHCYQRMFMFCSSLTDSPVIQATSLHLPGSPSYECEYMFAWCTSLTGVTYDLLPQQIGSLSYRSMFQECTSLVNAPEICATTCGSLALAYMFGNCTSLETGPSIILPERLPYAACWCMFTGCENLQSAPIIRASVIGEASCAEMFRGCRRITDPPELLPTVAPVRCYEYMFYGCTSLRRFPELNAETINRDCYNYMFGNCSSVEEFNITLPATTAPKQCYRAMFLGCTRLQSVPTNLLRAMDVEESAYSVMFSGCTSLTNVPDLPATGLSVNCYSAMFRGCTSLATIHSELPATTLAEGCYSGMYAGCTGITEGPLLPAPTIIDACYMNMFSGCTSLNSCKCLATTIDTSNVGYQAYFHPTHFWLSDTAPNGTLYVPAQSMGLWTTGDDGIPSTWQLQQYN